MPRYYYKGKVPVPVDLGGGNVISVTPKTEFEAPSNAIRGKLKKDTVKLPDKPETPVPIVPAPVSKPVASAHVPKPVMEPAPVAKAKEDDEKEEKSGEKSDDDKSAESSNRGRRRGGGR